MLFLLTLAYYNKYLNSDNDEVGRDAEEGMRQITAFLIQIMHNGTL